MEGLPAPAAVEGPSVERQAPYDYGAPPLPPAAPQMASEASRRGVASGDATPPLPPPARLIIVPLPNYIAAYRVASGKERFPRPLFFLGAIGCFIAVAGAIGLASTAVAWSPFNSGSYYDNSRANSLAAAFYTTLAILASGLILTSFGFFAMARTYNANSGVATGILNLVASGIIIVISGVVLMDIARADPSSSSYSFLDVMEQLFLVVFIGACLLVSGVSVWLCRFVLARQRLCAATATFFIISAGAAFSIVGFIILPLAPIASVPAFLLLASLFLKAKPVDGNHPLHPLVERLREQMRVDGL